jgi:hypothetical protein
MFIGLIVEESVEFGVSRSIVEDQNIFRTFVQYKVNVLYYNYSRCDGAKH